MNQFAKSSGKVVVQKDFTGPALREALKCKFISLKYVWFTRDIVGAAFYPKLKTSEEYAPRTAVLFKCVKKHLVHVAEHPIVAGCSQEELVRRIDTDRKSIYYLRF